MRRPRVPRRKASSSRSGSAGGVHLFNKNWNWASRTTRRSHDDTADPPLTSPQNAPLFVLRLGVLLHPMFAIEAEGVGIPTKARDTGASAFIIGARGSLVYNIMPGQIAGGKFVPFVLAGVGFLNVASSTDGEHRAATTGRSRRTPTSSSTAASARSSSSPNVVQLAA